MGNGSCGALPRHGDIVERQHLLADDRALFMALAGDKDHVVVPRIGNRCGNGSPAIADFAGAGRSGKNGCANRRRIFRTRVVVGDDHRVGNPCRRFAHQRPLTLITVAAGTEDQD